MVRDLPQWHDLAELTGDHCQSILDIGCGDGRTLQLCPHIPHRAGVDIDPDAIASAKKTLPHGDFRLAGGDLLPFADAQFDAIVSCVALPYMDIPVVLGECARVLKPSGKLFISVHNWKFLYFLWKQTPSNLAGKIFRAYVAMNGLSFHYFGKLFKYPLRPRMMESFQTEAALRRSLAAAGFEQFTALDRKIPSFSSVRK